MIVVTEITKSFQDVTALDNVSLRLGPGITVLLGPNGAGKTTLLRCLATVMRPDRGHVEVGSIRAGREADNRAIRRLIGYMPQSTGLPSGISVARHLDRIAVLKGIVDRQERAGAVDVSLDAVDLTSQSERKVQRLSGGMRRRLALAQALLGSPRILLLDEPTAGLDPEQRAMFRTFIGASGAAGTSVIVSTHQLEDVLGISGEVAVLTGGHVTFQGTPQSLAELARGRVWLTTETSPGSISWPMPDGRLRTLGEVSAGEPVEPTVEDGYLLLMQEKSADAYA
jgi:ABC-2 type transport system ATP-binding protein